MISLSGEVDVDIGAFDFGVWVGCNILATYNQRIGLGEHGSAKGDFTSSAIDSIVECELRVVRGTRTASGSSCPGISPGYGDIAGVEVSGDTVGISRGYLLGSTFPQCFYESVIVGDNVTGHGISVEIVSGGAQSRSINAEDEGV